MNVFRAAAIALGLIAGASLTTARADPWLAPGSDSLRSDIQLLADAYVLRGPTTTWPVSWPDIARDALAASVDGLDAATAAALLRVQRLARAASTPGFAGAGVRASASHEPVQLRGFADTPREEGEVALRASWFSNHLAANLQGALVADPDDRKKFRPDGTYLGVNVGNFMISAGYMERWWGPGWEGSLILSTNARPIPSVTLERNYTDPFKTRWLSWIGPWRASIAVGQTEGTDVAVPDVRFLAARVNFKPRPWLEFGLTRTAQWCGGNRPCGWRTFADMLLGKDNQEDPLANDEPGNQMAGYDLRLRSPWRALPLAFYTQWIGEDEAGNLPSKFLGLFGVETWASTRLGGWRFHAEYADTACMFTRQEPEFNCAYRNSLYPQGYTYRGRVIGHSMDNDSRMYSFGAHLARNNGDAASVTARRVEFNRDGTGYHAFGGARSVLDNVELRYSHPFGFGNLGVGVGYDKFDTEDARTGARAFVTFQQGF
ncbi:MAG: capsule assembly Wzi family protein [Pseudomonadota bacterium]